MEFVKTLYIYTVCINKKKKEKLYINIKKKKSSVPDFLIKRENKIRYFNFMLSEKFQAIHSSISYFIKEVFNAVGCQRAF